LEIFTFDKRLFCPNTYSMPKLKKAEAQSIAEQIGTLIDADRITSFSDAIFAFAATLLVLKIDLPKIPPELVATHFEIELYKLIPAYAANFVSFLVIAYYWRLHHKLFILIKRFDSNLVWLNVLALIFVSFLPFPIDLFGTYPSIAPVLVFYTASIAVVGFMLLAIWLYASHNHRLIDSAMKPEVIRYHTISNAIAPLVFLFSMPLAYYDHITAKMTWLLVIILSVLLNTFYARRLRKKMGQELEIRQI
jgi:uncharacterized membrane protein